MVHQVLHNPHREEVPIPAFVRISFLVYEPDPSTKNFSVGDFIAVTPRTLGPEKIIVRLKQR